MAKDKDRKEPKGKDRKESPPPAPPVVGTDRMVRGRGRVIDETRSRPAR